MAFDGACHDLRVPPDPPDPSVVIAAHDLSRKEGAGVATGPRTTAINAPDYQVAGSSVECSSPSSWAASAS